MNQMMPRVAFIIQCHKNPEQINILIESLKKIYNCHIFLHLDKKSWSISSKIQKELVTLLPEEKSVDVQWGKFSQCQATLTLIDEVLSTGEEFDYIWLISGQDLPIMGKEQANEVLPSTPVPFINVIGKENSMYASFLKRNETYYFDSMFKRDIPHKILRKGYQVVTGGKTHTWSIFRRTFEAPFYFGSSWWCLPYTCVREMKEVLDHSAEYMTFFKNALNSDESFFQTLFMQTSYAGQQKPITTFIDWSEGGASPKTFTVRDYEVLRKAKSGFLFARKFDMQTDIQICRRVLKEFCGLE